jgi:hypothetical protein
MIGDNGPGVGAAENMVSLQYAYAVIYLNELRI